MRVPDIAKSEWTVMEALWERSPQTASEVTKDLSPKTNWVENTVRTLLKRLVKKGALKIGKNAGGTKIFIPVVKREDCVIAEGESFMQRIFRGAPKPLLIHFATNAKLTPSEVKELKTLLDQSIDK
jgi:BlaI family transcriptional regulator, penicillinase repressor